jgi:copper chaperone CopZ
MENKLFKTNINCGSCIAKVTDTLNELVGEDNWEVDTTTPIKLLTIDNEAISASTISEALGKIGYSAIAI